MRRLLQAFALMILLPATAFAAFVLVWCLPVLRYGSFYLATCLGMVAFILLITACGCLQLSVIGLFLQRYRRQAAFALPLAAVFIGASYAGGCWGIELRMSAFDALAVRSTTLVSAIEQFEKEKGGPPRSLEQLVPDYLDTVPSTGMGGYPEYEYVSGDQAANCEGNDWVLLVPAPGPGMNFDIFMYFPDQNYPETGYGGWLERIRGWAYVHE